MGTINRGILNILNISGGLARELTLGELCRNVSGNLDRDVVYWDKEEDLAALLEENFVKKFPFSDELSVVEKENKKLIGIFDRRELFHEFISVSAEDENEMLCYREFSHYYKPHWSSYTRYAKNINSQHGEDGILNAIFDRIGTTSRYAVEFGGWDGIFLSNIRYLITDRGFSGLFIEGDEQRAENLLKNYADYPNVQCLAAYVSFQGENTLDNILKRKNAPEQIDLISIDIDGYDYHVWDSLKEYRPRVIIIEYNPLIPNDMIVVNPRSETAFCGSSAAALVELGRRKGYLLAAVTATNLIFVVEEEYDKLEIWDNSLDVLRRKDILADGRFFQTYRKEVILAGFPYYIWEEEGKKIDKENIIIYSM